MYKEYIIVIVKILIWIKLYILKDFVIYMKGNVKYFYNNECYFEGFFEVIFVIVFWWSVWIYSG